MSRSRIILDTEGVEDFRLAHAVKVVGNFDFPSQEFKSPGLIWLRGIHGNDFGDGPACIGNNEWLASVDLLEQLRQVFFGFANADDFHRRHREAYSA